MKQMLISIRPALNRSLDPAVFKNFYWDKKELVAFCLENKISATGGKIELSDRIELYLKTGTVGISDLKIKRKDGFDSERQITMDTPVVNYKNDTKTKEFFVEQLGVSFRFNDYLRQFAKTPNMDGSLTYGNLVKGWLESELHKRNVKAKAPIGKQFQFNQFQRDFYAAESGRIRAACLDAWKLVRSQPGAATYKHYLAILNTITNEKNNT